MVEHLLVKRQALALPDYLAVPMQAVGVEGAQDVFGGAGNIARRIQVFDADQPLPVVMACVQITGDGGQQRAEMQVTTGGGGEGPDIGGGHGSGALRRSCWGRQSAGGLSASGLRAISRRSAFP